jgi:uncharacterized protein
MRLTISDIPENGLEKDLIIPVLQTDVTLTEDIHLFLRVKKFKEKILISGHAESTAAVACSRCLNEFSCPIKIDFKVEYLPSTDYTEHVEHELSPGELDTSFYKDDVIDIENLLREQILLAVPMKPLCKSECLGICPQCGQDLNQRECQCSAEKIDPRLAKLKVLKESMKNK